MSDNENFKGIFFFNEAEIIAKAKKEIFDKFQDETSFLYVPRSMPDIMNARISDGGVLFIDENKIYDDYYEDDDNDEDIFEKMLVRGILESEMTASGNIKMKIPATIKEGLTFGDINVTFSLKRCSFCYETNVNLIRSDLFDIFLDIMEWLETALYDAVWDESMSPKEFAETFIYTIDKEKTSFFSFELAGEDTIHFKTSENIGFVILELLEFGDRSKITISLDGQPEYGAVRRLLYIAQELEKIL